MTVLKVTDDRRNGINSRFNLEASKYPSDTGAVSASENWMEAPSGARLGLELCADCIVSMVSKCRQWQALMKSLRAPSSVAECHLIAGTTL